MTQRVRLAFTLGVIALSALSGDAHPVPSTPLGVGRAAAAPPPVAADDFPLMRPPSRPPSASLAGGPRARTNRSPARSPSRASTPHAVDNMAARLRTLPAATRQVVIVTTASYATSYATVQTFVRTNSGWQPALGPMAARIGARGFTDRKAEGDLKTPTGVYSFGSTMYGIAANPGVRYRYHVLVAGDYWNGNPATAGYNTFVHGADPGGASGRLWQISPQYRYFAVVNYNIPAVAANPPRGSAIFLHQMIPGRSTAGCVALAEGDLLRVLRWLDPSAAPRIVMAPSSALSRY